MANADSITVAPKVISGQFGQFGMPKISMPEDIAEDANGRLSFKISTHCGTIDVTSWGSRRWECRGSASALEAGGFLRLDWCPGLPGNNKTRQTVLFEAEGPRLVLGNRKSQTMSYPFIVVARVSAKTFIVEVPVTEGQGELLSQAWKRGAQRQNEDRLRNERIKEQTGRRKEKEERYSGYCRSPSLFKDDSVYILKKIFSSSMEKLSGKDEFDEYGEATIWIDEQSMQEVLSAGARLFEAVRNAKVVCQNRALHLSVVK